VIEKMNPNPIDVYYNRKNKTSDEQTR